MKNATSHRRDRWLQLRVDAIGLSSHLDLQLLLLAGQGFNDVLSGHFFQLAFIFLFIVATNSSLSGNAHNVDPDLPLRDLLLLDVDDDVDQWPGEDTGCFSKKIS